MSSGRSRAGVLVDGMLAYLEAKTKALIDARNEAEPGLDLVQIASFEKGYRDVLTGLRAYPGLIVINRGRKSIDSYFATYRLLIGIAVKSEHADYLQRLGEAYEDILEDALLADPTLGGICIDSNGLDIANDCASGVYVISCSLEADVDRGGTIYE